MKFYLHTKNFQTNAVLPRSFQNHFIWQIYYLLLILLYFCWLPFIYFDWNWWNFLLSGAVPQMYSRKKCFKNIQQIYRRTPMWSLISIKLKYNFIEITLPHGYCPVDLLNIFKTLFYENTCGGLLLFCEVLPLLQLIGNR